MFTHANEPQSIGGVLDSGFKLFTASIKQVAPITYLGALGGAIGAWVLQTSMLNQIAEGGAPLDFDVPLLAGTYIAMVIVGTILMAAAIIRIRAVFTSETMSFGLAMLGGMKRAPAVIGASLIYMLAFLVGSILLIVPGIYISVMLAFAFYAAAADNNGPIESIKYSYGLVKGNWWRTAGLLTIMMIVVLVFYVAVGFVVGILAASSDSAQDLQPSILGDIVIIPVITAVITAMMYCLAYAVYHDLKLRSQGIDLAERIESLDKE
ncbi:hypothetical protein [Eudoraea sp.]|uniref:DUF7847 domain-containing protein n=1 Tax=Eudoraea sp. TaxID=1979955 RepID=UPI003C70B168